MRSWTSAPTQPPCGIEALDLGDDVRAGRLGRDELAALRELAEADRSPTSASQSATPASVSARTTASRETKTLESQSRNDPGSRTRFVGRRLAATKSKRPLHLGPAELADHHHTRHAPGEGLEDHASGAWVDVREQSHGNGAENRPYSRIALDHGFGGPPSSSFDLDHRPGSRRARDPRRSPHDAPRPKPLH